ncbi:Leucine-rich repeat flightless-interacting protein 2 [Bagarius yarrelli]|uniref:Leucine-rich repeat flightless-interacting protein 2 n=1 Tax=Bagarius yarrelli TaxID=175774 RepID=A0A556V6G9_BAGYA|nr:Leucine-rich repeat flightless-interacting protein 2 [Bagarius yarrelli]
MTSLGGTNNKETEMGTPSSGRKRAPIKDRFSAEDEALSSIAREAEARLAAKRAARAEARDIRMRELERQQKESSGFNDLQRKPASLKKKPDLLAFPITSTGLTRSHSAASISDASLCGPYGSRASLSDDDSSSTTYQDHIKHGRKDSVLFELSDMSETAADYFSRPNRRGSIISDLDDLSIPDMDILDEKCDKQYSDSFSRPSSRCTTPGLSAATLASLGGTLSRRGSVDVPSIVIDPEVSLGELKDIYDLKDQIHDVEGRYMQGLKELKESLSEVEEKYKKAMVSNAQLDNDKANLIYQVDTLKDVIEGMEEQMSELIKETEEKSRELERQKHTCSVLMHKQEELKEGIRQRDELIEAKQDIQFKLDKLTREVFELQETVNWKDKKLAALERQKEYFDYIRNERDELRHELADLKGKSKSVEIRKLKSQLQEERQKHSKTESVFSDGELLENGTDFNLIEMQKDANRQISEYKFKLSKADQEMGTMEQNINRLEGQVLRYKTAAENFEKIEEELKAEKRKLQRELRGALEKIEEMEMTNNHLVKRLEKMKANRNALLSQQ